MADATNPAKARNPITAASTKAIKAQRSMRLNNIIFRAQRLFTVGCVVLIACELSGCSGSHQADEDHSTRRTVGEVAGKLAYKASRQAEKAAVVAGRDLHRTAIQAHKGWKEAAEEDRAKRLNGDKHSSEKK